MNRCSGGPSCSHGGPDRDGGTGGGGTGNEDGVGPKSVICLISCVGGCGSARRLSHSSAADANPATRPSASAERYTPAVTSSKRVLHLTRVGADARPPHWLAMLHGVYGRGRNWQSIAKDLLAQRPDWGSVLIDLRLHGDSLGFAPPHTLATAAADVEATVEALAAGTATATGTAAATGTGIATTIAAAPAPAAPTDRVAVSVVLGHSF